MYVCMYNKSTNRQYSTQYRTNVVYYSLLRQRISLRGRTYTVVSGVSAALNVHYYCRSRLIYRDC